MNPLSPPQKKSREPMELQLTAMIDVFTMIILFLVMGTYFGVSDMVIPADLLLPKSLSSEDANSAPQVLIRKHGVVVSIAPEGVVPVEAFANPADPAVAKLKKRVKEYVSKIPEDGRKSGVLLNVVADESMPYEHIFNVVKVLREGGFETLLFVAQSAPEKAGK